MIKKYPFTNHIAIYISILFVSYFISVRDLDIGTDTFNYMILFKKSLNPYLYIDTEILFLALNKLVGFFTTDYRFLLFFCASISLFFSLLMIKKSISFFCDSYRDVDTFYIVIFSIFLLSPFTFNANTNVIRQGLSTPILITAFIMFAKRKYINSLVLFLLAIGFHKSSFMFFLLSPLMFVGHKKLVLIVSMLSIFYISGIAYNILQPVFEYFGIIKYFIEIKEYGISSSYKSGIRIDFFLFSIFFIFLSYIGYMKKYIIEELVKILLILFIPFLLFGYMAYSDRLLLALWYTIPIVLLIPFIKFYNNWPHKNTPLFLLIFCTTFIIYRLF